MFLGRSKKVDQPHNDQALGRSRGGLSTKIHMLCGVHGHPLHFELSAVQAHEASMLEEVLLGADASLCDLAWPVSLAGDKAYRAAWIDEYLSELEIRPVIPNKRKTSEDREFDRGAYCQRNIAERLIGWLKEPRRVLTRYEKNAKNYAGMLRMSCIDHYLRIMT